VENAAFFIWLASLLTRVPKHRQVGAHGRSYQRVVKLAHGSVPFQADAKSAATRASGPAYRLGQGYGGPPKLHAKAEAGHHRVQKRDLIFKSRSAVRE